MIRGNARGDLRRGATTPPGGHRAADEPSREGGRSKLRRQRPRGTFAAPGVLPQPQAAAPSRRGPGFARKRRARSAAKTPLPAAGASLEGGGAQRRRVLPPPPQNTPSRLADSPLEGGRSKLRRQRPRGTFAAHGVLPQPQAAAPRGGGRAPTDGGTVRREDAAARRRRLPPREVARSAGGCRPPPPQNTPVGLPTAPSKGTGTSSAASAPAVPLPRPVYSPSRKRQPPRGGGRAPPGVLPLAAGCGNVRRGGLRPCFPPFSVILYEPSPAVRGLGEKAYGQW